MQLKKKIKLRPVLHTVSVFINTVDKLQDSKCSRALAGFD